MKEIGITIISLLLVKQLLTFQIKKFKKKDIDQNNFQQPKVQKKYKTMRKFFDNKLIKSGVMPKRKRPKRDYSA